MRSRRRPKIVHVFRSLKFQNIIRLPKPALRFWPVRLALFGSYRYRWLYLIHSMSLRTKKRPNLLNDMLKFESPVKWQLSDAKITLAVSHGPLKSKNSLKFTVWTNQWFFGDKKRKTFESKTLGGLNESEQNVHIGWRGLKVTAFDQERTQLKEATWLVQETKFWFSHVRKMLHLAAA